MRSHLEQDLMHSLCGLLWACCARLCVDRNEVSRGKSHGSRADSGVQTMTVSHACHFCCPREIICQNQDHAAIPVAMGLIYLLVLLTSL
jgi:hypothetical protein